MPNAFLETLHPWQPTSRSGAAAANEPLPWAEKKVRGCNARMHALYGADLAFLFFGLCVRCAVVHTQAADRMGPFPRPNFNYSLSLSLYLPRPCSRYRYYLRGGSFSQVEKKKEEPSPSEECGHFDATLTPFWTGLLFFSLFRWALHRPRTPCYPLSDIRSWRRYLSDADWCLQSDGMPASRLFFASFPLGTVPGKRRRWSCTRASSRYDNFGMISDRFCMMPPHPRAVWCALPGSHADWMRMVLAIRCYFCPIRVFRGWTSPGSTRTTR